MKQMILFTCLIPTLCFAHLPVINLPPLHGHGFFSVFLIVLGAFNEIEEGRCDGINIDLGKSKPYYDKSLGENWWSYYFDHTEINCGLSKTITDYHEIGKLAQIGECQISREKASYLICKYLQIKQHILDQVDSFVLESFLKPTTIGIHYRGTDKINEAPRTQYKSVTKTLLALLNKSSIGEFQIYIATDEKGFLDYMIEKLPNHVIYFQGINRSTNGLSVHNHTQTPYKCGEDALIDCLVLSKCNYLIRTSSNLSRVSMLINPDLKVIEISKRN